MVVLASFYRRVSSRLTENGGSSFSLLTNVLALVDARPEDRYRVGLFPDTNLAVLVKLLVTGER